MITPSIEEWRATPHPQKVHQTGSFGKQGCNSIITQVFSKAPSPNQGQLNKIKIVSSDPRSHVYTTAQFRATQTLIQPKILDEISEHIARHKAINAGQGGEFRSGNWGANFVDKQSLPKAPKMNTTVWARIITRITAL